MSASTDAHHDAAVHHGDGHGATAHGSLSGYMIGFVLSVVLTAVPFWLVMGHVAWASMALTLAIMGLAVVQIVVHMVYFLHMNAKVEGGWSMLAMIFTVVLVVITISGSVWVMYHMNSNMMPMGSHDMHNMT